ncbi:DUF6089 family protein [Bacteroidota bacterium]
MKRIGILLVMFVFTGLLSECVFAQAGRKKSNNLRVSRYKGSLKSYANKRYFAIGGMINTMNYFGDLAPKSQAASTDISFTKPGFGAFVEYRYGPRFSFGSYFTYGSLKGDDFESADPNDENAKFRYIRNLQFRNRILELALLAKIDIFSNQGTYLSRPTLNGYLFGGIAGLHHNPKGKVPETDRDGNPLENAGDWIALEPLGTEGQYSEYYQDTFNVKPYSKLQISIPFGAGITYRLTANFDISFEIGYRMLFFDHIDDVGGLYVDLGAFDDPLAKIMSDRSQELTAAVSGEQRDFDGTILPNTSYATYTSELDGQTYTVFGGYGHEHPDNTRGNSNDNDIYFVTSIKLTYILGGTFQNAKFR